RHPRSILFPYTTLFRSEALARYGLIFMIVGVIAAQGLRIPIRNPQLSTAKAAASHPGASFTALEMLRTPIFWLMFVMMTMMSTRSEEHTSELQSRGHLV